MNFAARVLAPLVCLAAFLSRQPAGATELSFSLYALGVPVAESAMHVDVRPSAYSMTLRYHTTGLGRLISGDRLYQESQGRLDGVVPTPAAFQDAVHLKGQDRHVALTFQDGGVQTSTIIPPNEPEREDVPKGMLTGIVDPLSAMVAMLSLAAKSGRCDISDRTYDGRRLELFEAHTVGQEDLPPDGRSRFAGKALRCDYTSRTLAGFRRDDGRAEDGRQRAGTIWLAPVIPGGTPVPVHGQIDTRFLGPATMYLTAVTP